VRICVPFGGCVLLWPEKFHFLATIISGAELCINAERVDFSTSFLSWPPFLDWRASGVEGGSFISCGSSFIFLKLNSIVVGHFVLAMLFFPTVASVRTPLTRTILTCHVSICLVDVSCDFFATNLRNNIYLQ